MTETIEDHSSLEWWLDKGAHTLYTCCQSPGKIIIVLFDPMRSPKICSSLLPIKNLLQHFVKSVNKSSSICYFSSLMIKESFAISFFKSIGSIRLVDIHWFIYA